MTGGRDQRSGARQLVEAPCSNQDGSVEQMSIPWDPWKHDKWGAGGGVGAKAGFTAYGMEFFQLGIKGKDYP